MDGSGTEMQLRPLGTFDGHRILHRNKLCELVDLADGTILLLDKNPHLRVDRVSS